MDVSGLEEMDSHLRVNPELSESLSLQHTVAANLKRGEVQRGVLCRSEGFEAGGLLSPVNVGSSSFTQSLLLTFQRTEPCANTPGPPDGRAREDGARAKDTDEEEEEEGQEGTTNQEEHHFRHQNVKIPSGSFSPSHQQRVSEFGLMDSVT
ncbi:Hypothetical predicted protein [Xyrichtys novacula]|uniref:Uncharacterized protein n=1 Tax=Xyrichtys novacula TaxID=13765 RepID=A0AAV1G606_XYRNO|nr:Hypothetical predicted protein [Xyrichtys novacula]